MMKLKNIKSLKMKILLPTLTLLFFGLAVTGSISSYLNYSSTESTLKQTLTETALIVADRVAVELDGYTRLVDEFSKQTNIIYGTKNQIEEEVKLIEKRHTFTSIYRTDTMGNVMGSNTNISDRDYFTNVKSIGKSYISDLVIRKDNGSMNIFISSPIIKNGKFDGIIFAGLDATFLCDIVAGISMGETGNAAILDKNGTTLAYADASLVLNGYNTQNEVANDPSLEQLAQIERKMAQGETGFEHYTYGGVKKFMAYAPIPNTNGWSVDVAAVQNEFMSGTKISIIITIGMVFVFLFLTAFILILLVRGIVKPIVEIENVAKKMSLGDYDCDILYTSNDEIGNLSESMRTMTKTTKNVIEDTVRGLSEIASGNFDISPRVEYVGIFKSIESSMIKIILDLSSTLQQIRNSANEVNIGSDQVSSTSQSLAQGANEQSDSIEKLSISIANVTLQVKDNADNAKNASEMADIVETNVNTSNEQMHQMTMAMSEINQSSTDISKIIKAIEDIAFQTNILALNAAVEAARAGIAGKGFAVVADEVRNLSIKSSEAAKETNLLIEHSIRSVDKGSKIVDDTAKSLSAVVKGSKEIIAVIGNIANATVEQADVIEQINLGVEQISSVVQTNSATSEESAAASEELAGQAALMNGLLARFHLKGEISHVSNFDIEVNKNI